MKVSVIIPVYNRAQLVKKAIESVRQQTYQPFEIIVVDDGSTESEVGSRKSGVINGQKNLSGLRTQDSRTTLHVGRALPVRLKLIRQKNKGVAAARNLGIKHSKGEWLAFLDSDDYWLPEKLEKQVAFHKENCRLLISQTDEVWIRSGIRVNQNKPNVKVGGDIFERSLERCLISPSAVLLHRDLLDMVGNFDESLPVCEDYDLWLRITCRYQVGLVPEKLVVKHGGHFDQLSKKYEAMDRFRVKALQKLLSSGILTETQKEAVQAMLSKKIAILENGARKRNRPSYLLM